MRGAVIRHELGGKWLHATGGDSHRKDPMPSERMPQRADSWMSPLLKWLTMAVVRFPGFTLGLALAAAGFSIWLAATRLDFHTSRAELLNPKSDYNRRWLEYTKEFGDKEDVVVVVEGANGAQTTAAAEHVCRALAQQSNLFTAVLHDIDAPKLRQKGLYYLKTQDLLRIDGFLHQAGVILDGDWSQLNLGSMGHWIEAALAAGSPAQRQQTLASVERELPRVVTGLVDALAARGKYESPWPDLALSNPMVDHPSSTRLMSDDGRMALVLLKLVKDDRRGFARNNESIVALRRLTGEVMAQHPGVKIGLTGLPIIEYDEMRSSEQSMTAATVLSFLGVLAVIVVALGGLRHSLLAMVALVVGMVWACGCVTLSVGYVTILSIAFGSILFGLGIDYGIYYVTRYLQLRETVASPAEALVAAAITAGPGITTSAVTSAISFFAAGFTEFPGVAQLGMVAGAGIMLCWLAQMTVLPAMICLLDAEGIRCNLPAPLNLKSMLYPLFAMPRFALGLTALGTLVLAAGMQYLRYDYNLLHMQPAGLESVELERKLTQQTNNSSWFALSLAKTPAEVMAKKDAFLKLPSVARVEEVASKFPSEVGQKQPLVEDIHRRLAHLPLQPPSIAVTPPAELDRMLAGMEPMLAPAANAAQAAAGLRQVRELLRRLTPAEYQQRIGEYQQAAAADLLARLRTLQAVSFPQPPRLADLPEGVLVRAVGKTGRYLLRVYSKNNIWDVDANTEFVHQVRSVDAEATGNPLQVYEASRHMKRSFENAAWYALLAIVPVVLFDFRRLSHSLLAALPMGVGMLQTFGLMGLLDIPLNPANMIVLPLVLGIGMEGGINLVHDLRTQGRRYRGAGNDVLVAVAVNALTTMVGFGALMIASHQGLQSLGRVLTIAMGCCLLSSLILPNLLSVGGFAGKSGDDYDESEADDAWDEEASGSAGEYAEEEGDRYVARVA